MTLDRYGTAGCLHCAKANRELDALGLDYGCHGGPGRHAGRDMTVAVSGPRRVPSLADADGMPARDDTVGHLERTYGWEVTS